MNRDQVCEIPIGHLGDRVCIISSWNDHYAPLAAIARANWEAYARRHGYALRLYPGAYHEDPARPDTYGDKGKFQLYYDVRGHCEMVVWIDIDSLIMTPDLDLRRLMWGERFLWTYDENGPLSGLWIARTDGLTEKHLRAAYELAARENNVRHGRVEPNGISDQDAMTRIMRTPPFDCTFGHPLPAKDIGHCYPENWEKGDFLVTFPGRPLEEKLHLMRDWEARTHVHV